MCHFANRQVKATADYFHYIKLDLSIQEVEVEVHNVAVGCFLEEEEVVVVDNKAAESNTVGEEEVVG